MARNPECQASYEVANQWRERCLVSDKSLLWPELEEPTWTIDNIGALLTAFLGSPDPSHDSFTTKWRRQLEDQSEAVHRVAADVMVIYALFTSLGVMGPNAKRSLINEVASWKAGAIPESATLNAALSCGLGHPGMFYHNKGRPWQVAFFLDFAKRAKKQSVDLFNVDEIKELAAHAYKSDSSASGARNVLFHLFFPDQYESIASQAYKQEIVHRIDKSLIEGIDLPSDVDDALILLRKKVSEHLGREDFQFWDADVIPLWKPPEHEWIHFVDNTPGFLEWCREHPSGFVLNTRRHVKANDLVLHRTTCGHLSFSDDSVNLTGPYTKVCSNDKETLRHWATTNVGPNADIRNCSTCRPDGDHPSTRYWKIAPGEGGKYWTRFRDSGAIFLGWDGSPDLRQSLPGSEEQVKSVLESTQSFTASNYSASTAAAQLWKFYSEMAVGDLVCSYSNKKVFGWGRITGEYEFDSTLDTYCHRRAIHWDSISPIPASAIPDVLLAKLQQYVTIVELTLDEFQQIRALAPDKPRRVWVEKANSWQSKSDPTYRSGNVFLYPTKDAGGHDIFHSLGELRVGDVIIHLFDTKTFTQRSVVGESAIEIDGTPHGYPGQQYLVRLTNQEKVVPELEWTAVKEQIGPRLLDFGMSCEEKLFYLPSEGLPLRSFEGVTVAPTSLIDILNEASNELTGFDLLPPGWPEDDGLAGLARAVFMKRAELAVTDELLKAKHQIIFEGPPGSGKTFVARLFARYLAGLPLEGPPDPQVEIVQFHQSYGYEDFVAGIRPRTTPEGNIRYDVQPGIFIEMCQRAQANPDKKFVLIIDEINRGNLSRIFGELLYALEYRDEPVRIQYPDMLGDESADHMTIPKNLYLIGTMNSTDRSLAMIDYALRRRFYFWKLMPVVGGNAPVLEGWLRAKGIEEQLAAQLLAAFVAVNNRIAELLNSDFQIGHSYFMVDGLGDPPTLPRIWKHALLPLLEEYFHNRRDRELLIEELRSILLSGGTGA